MLANVIRAVQSQMRRSMEAAKIPVAALNQQSEDELKAQAQYYLGLCKYDYN